MDQRPVVGRWATLRNLFARRQVYVRDPVGSRYVTISGALQVAVTVTVVLLVAGLGVASVGAVATRVESIAQERELARLANVNKGLRAAVDAIGGLEALETAAAQLPKLNDQLRGAEAARTRALQLAEAATAEAAELRRELFLARDQVRDLERLASGIAPGTGGESTPVMAAGGTPPIDPKAPVCPQ